MFDKLEVWMSWKLSWGLSFLLFGALVMDIFLRFFKLLPNIDLRCFVERIIVADLRTFWRTFYRPKKYGGVPKMTIIRYELIWT